MTFRGKQWQRSGNCYNLVGYQIDIYQWNSGKKPTFLYAPDTRTETTLKRLFQKGQKHETPR